MLEVITWFIKNKNLFNWIYFLKYYLKIEINYQDIVDILKCLNKGEKTVSVFIIFVSYRIAFTFKLKTLRVTCG